MNLRKIIHIDMDAFYASVEMRDDPTLKNKPVIVGGMPDSRGVVAACSYEARKFGIHSAMSSAKAYKLCPSAVFLKPSFDKYKDVSRQIREIFGQYTDLVEPLSLDEAYLDITNYCKNNNISATEVAKQIRQTIFEKTGLTASAGVSFNKFLAKVASDVNKPNGQKVITPKEADKFIENLAIGKFFGIGKVTEKKMISMGIKTGADLKKVSLEILKMSFGKAGEHFYNIVRTNDNRPVTPNWIRKSIGQERTLKSDITDIDKMYEILEVLTNKVIHYLEKNEKMGKTITLKVKYYNFISCTRSITLTNPTKDFNIIMHNLKQLLKKTDAGQKEVRLLGLSISNLISENEINKDDSQLMIPI